MAIYWHLLDIYFIAGFNSRKRTKNLSLYFM